LPDLPSPKTAITWFRERRIRRKLAAWCIGAAVILIGAGIAAPRISRVIKGWQARRLTNQAFALIDQHNWREAAKKIQGAFQLRNTEPEVWRAYARFLSRTGQASLALEWWQKTAQSRALSIDDQRDYAAAALNARELGIAAEQVALLLSQPAGPAAQDLLLAAQLATIRGYMATARQFAERILTNTRSNSDEKLGANLVILSTSTPDMESYKQAAQRLLEIARNESDPASPQALTVLGRQGNPRRLTTPATETLAIPAPDVADNTIPLTEIADRLDHNPNSRPYHHMLALEMRARANPARQDELVVKAMHSYGQGDDETLQALGAWLYLRKRFESMLKILPLERAAQRRELLMEHIDALAELHRFSELKEILLREHPVLEPSFQHMYLAVVQAKLSEPTSSENEWARALDSAETPRTLIGLADYAERMQAFEIADAAYARLIKKQPALKSAYASRLKLAQVRGQTSQAHDLAVEILRIWPEDDATRVREIYLRLLVEQSAAQASAAEKEAALFLARNPWDGVARSAVALAQLKQERFAAALTTLTEFNSQVPSSAISLPVLAAALAANGWKDKALEEVQKLATVKLLPEERALIAPLLRNGDH